MCEFEDSTFCYWDASTQGNGIGTSFLSLWEGFTIPITSGLTGTGFAALVLGTLALIIMYKKGLI